MVDGTVWDDGDRREPDLTCGAKSVPGRADCTPRARAEGLAPLVRSIEAEIIPRLLLTMQSHPAVAKHRGCSVAAVATFARLVSNQDVRVASAHIHTLLARGVALEHIYLQLLAPAARLLHEWWKQDTSSFVEVTAGLCRMHQLLHEFSPVFLRDSVAKVPGRAILLVSMPGDQHSFGLIMVAEFFRRAGWDVWDLHPSKNDDLLQVLSKRSFSVVGVSLACESRIAELGLLISRMREISRNRSINIMVGGQPFTGRAQLINQVGADCTAADGRGAVARASRLVDLSIRPG